MNLNLSAPYRDHQSSSGSDDDDSFRSDEECGQITMAGGSVIGSKLFDQSESTAEDSSHDNDLEEVPIDSFEHGGSLPSVEDIRMMVLSRSHSSRPSRSCRFWGLVVIAAVVFVGSGAVLVNRNNRSDGTASSNLAKENNSESAPTVVDSAPTNGDNSEVNNKRATLAQIRRFVMRNHISSKEMLKQAGSPQFRASRWMATQDPAPLSAPTDDDSAYNFMTRYIMAVNYFSLGGGKKNEFLKSLHFLTDKHVCDWNGMVKTGEKEYPTGLICDDEGKAQELVLDFNKLQGSIPTENGKLSTLKRFDLKGNDLTGSIPTELCQLTSLNTLSLGYNMLDGTLPVCLGNLQDLEILFLSDNAFHGPLPSRFMNLLKLRKLFVDNNQLTENPRAIIKRLLSLEDLYIDNNGFTGTVNNALVKQHTELQRVDMSNNKLEMSKTFPTIFLELPKLEVLDLSRNKMVGQLPSRLAENSPLEFLALHDNQIGGTIPIKMIGSLGKLQHLDLSDNKLTGELPSEWSSKLKYLFVGNNPGLLAGPIPTSLESAGALEELSLKNTNREGSLPELSSLQNLVMLDLDNNRLTGTVPATWKNLVKLQYLLLNRNEGVNGTLPSEDSAFSSIKIAYLDGTALSGNIEFMCSSKNVKVVANCQANQITKCSCCQCCESTEACSDPMVASLNAQWETEFRRSSYYFDARVAL